MARPPTIGGKSRVDSNPLVTRSHLMRDDGRNHEFNYRISGRVAFVFENQRRYFLGVTFARSFNLPELNATRRECYSFPFVSVLFCFTTVFRAGIDC